MPSPRWLVGPVAGCLFALGQPAAAVSTTDFPQQEANPPLKVPATASCQVDVMTHDFAFSYGAPFRGQFAPPAQCPAPWSEIVLTFSASVGGVQFDRLVDAYFGGVLVYSGSTSEPCCTPPASTPVASEPGATSHWSVQKDVTEYAPVLAAPQPVEVDLNNVVNSSDTGIYHTTLTLTFYETAKHVAAGAHPDVVLPFNQAGNSGVDGYLNPDAQGDVPPGSITFPRNLVQLRAELFAQGHGPGEEFWWGDPAGSSNGTGTPYREVGVYLDGRLAGAAPVYPVVFTGGDGPGLWEPIPSPRAWNLTPFTVDLTPFVGTLTDGLPHHVALHVFDIDLSSGDYWLVQANLLGWVGPTTEPTVGGLISTSAPAAPTETGGWDPSGNAVYQDQVAHDLSFAGWLDTAGGRRTTEVDDSIAATSTETAVTTQTAWDWKAVTTSTLSRPHKPGQTEVSSQEQKFSIDSETLTRFAFTDSIASRSPAGWSTYSETMSTADATGIVYNGVEREQYAAGDSSGLCYDRTLTAAAGNIVADQSDSACPAAPG